MRHVLYLAIVILTLTQIHAQQADAITTNASKGAHRSCSGGPFLATDAQTNQLTTSDLLVGYAAKVSGCFAMSPVGYGSYPRRLILAN